MEEHAGDPVRDPARLAELARLGLADGRRDEVLEELVEEAARDLGLPMAFVSIVLDEAQIYAARRGLGGWIAEAGGVPVEWSFCAHTVRSGETLVVEDAERHPLVRDNPLVKMDGIRCYAGVPLRSARGIPVGTLCVAGNDPRSFDDGDLDRLRALARRVEERLEARVA